MTRIHPEVPRRTEAILKFIRTFHAAQGYAPTRSEIGKACHLSTSMVNYYLDALQDAGRLTVARNVARGIVLVEAAPTEADDASKSPEGDWQVANRVARQAG